MAFQIATQTKIVAARRRFAAELGIDESTVGRIIEAIEQQFSRSISDATEEDLLLAADWAAQRIREQFDVHKLNVVAPLVIAMSLADGCPLCASYESPPRGMTPVSSGGMLQGA